MVLINDVIYCICIGSVCIDTAAGEKKVSAILGDQIWEEMSDCIIQECLLYSIPANSSQLAAYDTVTTGSNI